MQLDLATAEYIGAREQQQDLAAALPLVAGALLVLADGLGGHESGADAARLVVTTFKEAGAAGRFKNPATRRQVLREVLDLANARIAERADPAHGHRGMASTVVAAVVDKGELRWVSVGDSHLYLWRGGRLHKLNEDHSQAGLMIRSGQYQPGDPEVQAVKSVLVSALTGRKLEIVDLPQSSFQLAPGDVLMLASDGLNTLSDDEIEQIVDDVRDHGAIRLSTTLLESVRSRRLERQDNTTVVIARVLEPARAIVPAAPARRPESVSAAALDDTSEERTQRVTPDAAQQPTRDVPTKPLVHSTPASAEEQTSSTNADAERNEPSPPVGDEVSAEPETRSKEAAKSPLLKPRSERPEPPRLAEAEDGSESEPVALGAAPADVVPEVLPPRARRAATPLPEAPDGRSRVAQGLLLLVLVLLLASGVAIAALRPQWLNGVVPGFGDGNVVPPVSKGEADATPQVAPAPAQEQPPAAVAPPPAADPPSAPKAGPEPPAQAAIPAPAPVPATPPPAPSAAEPSTTNAVTAPTEGTVPSQAPQQSPAAPTPQLVEPERPAPRPGERGR